MTRYCRSKDHAAAASHPLVADHLAYRRARRYRAALTVLTWAVLAAMLWVLCYG